MTTDEVYDTNDESCKITEGFREAIILHDNYGDNEIVGHFFDQRVGLSGTVEETKVFSIVIHQRIVHDIYFWLFNLGVISK